MKSLVTVAAVAILATTAVLCPATAADPPTGKVADLVKNLSAKDELTRLKAALELGKLSKPAVEPVGAALTNSDADTRYYAVWALGLLGHKARDKVPDVIKLLGDKSEQVRRKAVFALGRVTADPNEALPALIKALADPNEEVKDAAAEACALFGAEAVQPLSNALKSPDARVRWHAAHALGAVGPSAREAIPSLTNLLADKDQAVMSAAATVLAKFGKESLPALTGVLKSDNPHVRSDAVRAIGKVEGSEAIFALVGALRSAHPDVRQDSARVLGELGVTDKLVVLALAEVLRNDADGSARTRAAEALGMIGLAARPATAELTRALADNNTLVQRAAFSALYATGVNPLEAAASHFKSGKAQVRVGVASLVMEANPQHAEAVRVLTETLAEKDEKVRRDAAIILVQAGAPGATLDVLIEALKDKDIDVRRSACRAIASVEHRPEKTKAALAGATKDEDAGVRSQALVGLWERFREGGFPYYVEGMKDRDPFVRANAVSYVASSGKATVDMIPHLRELATGDENQGARYGATIALSRMGPEAIPALIELLPVRNGDIQRTAMQGLQRQGPRSKDAVAALLSILKERGHQYRWLAAETLGAIGPEAKGALDTLRDAAGEADAQLKEHAEQALRLIEKKCPQEGHQR